jgi:hypothetical protein
MRNLPATGRIARLARMVGRRNTLKRPVDRLESTILVVLVAAFCAVLAVAAGIGNHTYQWQRAAAAADLTPVSAVLLQAGPPAGSLPLAGQAEARWRDPGGGERTGLLTTATAPGIADAKAGGQVQVWLNHSGAPAAPPSGQAVMIIYAAITAGAMAAIAAVALLIAYAVSRFALDRRRLAAWESAWARTEPSWTLRR